MKKNLFDNIAKTAKRFASPMGYSKKQPLKEMTMREMLAKTRQQVDASPSNKVESLNEQRHRYLGEDDATAEPTEKQVSPEEQKKYERNMLDYFDDDNIIIKFEPVLVADEGVFWAGTIDGQLKFAYMVTPDEATSGVKIERSPDFDPNSQENQEIEKKIISYYDTFYEYWSKNQLEK
jgi:hypothetical protein